MTILSVPKEQDSYKRLAAATLCCHHASSPWLQVTQRLSELIVLGCHIAHLTDTRVTLAKLPNEGYPFLPQHFM